MSSHNQASEIARMQEKWPLVMKVNARRPHQSCLLATQSGTVVPGATIQKDASICILLLLLLGILTKLDTIELTPKQYAEAMVRILLHNIFHVTRNIPDVHSSIQHHIVSFEILDCSNVQSDSDCEEYKAYGSCESEDWKTWMELNCRKACGYCETGI